MNICLIGPSRSGKSLLATNLASRLKMPIIDTGQIIRLTADPEDQARLAAGGLSQRGGKGTTWANELVDRALADEEHIIVGYPRSIDQFNHIKGRALIACLMVDIETMANRPTGGRPDNVDKNVLMAKHVLFFDFLRQIWKEINIFVDCNDIDNAVYCIEKRLSRIKEGG